MTKGRKGCNLKIGSWRQRMENGIRILSFMYRIDYELFNFDHFQRSC
jgi:hypothetical protein